MRDAYREKSVVEYYVTWSKAGAVECPKGDGWTLDSWHTPGQACMVQSDCVLAIFLWRREV
jgi:hypothetical protein